MRKLLKISYIVSDLYISVIKYYFVSIGNLYRDIMEDPDFFADTLGHSIYIRTVSS